MQVQASLEAIDVQDEPLHRELARALGSGQAEWTGMRFREALPWEAFASAWSLAEDRLARLEQQLSCSDLRHCWICRADFQEAAAVTALAGRPVAMEDLVLVDSGCRPDKPTEAWLRARAVLSLRRQISRSGPAKTLTCDGILALAARMQQILAGKIEDGTALEEGATREARERIQCWLDVVEELRTTPALPAAAVALRAWRRIAPLDSCNAEIGALLATLLLWHWGKTKGLTACLAVGLSGARWRLDDQAGLGTWIRQFCEAVQVAANNGLDWHHCLTRSRKRLVELLARHRANSRLPRLAWLLLSYPALSTRFIRERLGVTPQGSTWLLEEFIRDEIVHEITGRTKNRVYSLDVGGVSYIA